MEAHAARLLTPLSTVPTGTKTLARRDSPPGRRTQQFGFSYTRGKSFFALCH